MKVVFKFDTYSHRMKKQLLHRVFKLSKLLAWQKRKTRRAIELLKKKMQLSCVKIPRVSRLCRNKMKTLCGLIIKFWVTCNRTLSGSRLRLLQERKADLVEKNAALAEEHADLVENHAAQVAGVSGDRDAALAALRRLRVEVPLDESQLPAVRAEIDTVLKLLKIAQIRCNATQAVANNNPMYCCRISLGLMHDPVSTSNCMTYERVAIEEWLATLVREKKPLMCPHRNPLVSTQLTPNFLVKNMISEVVDKEVARLSKPTPRHPLG